MKKKGKLLKTYFCGLAMGAADVVPGVSGGTIAFITGIYSELVNAIKSADMEFFRLFFSGKIREAFARIPFSFLLPLLLGIGTALFSLAKVIVYLLEFYPLFIWTFFLGLILSSAFLLYKELPNKNIKNFFIFLIGAIFAYFLSALPVMQTPDTYFFTFLAGAIAICAMILPGISGSFLLVVMGKYELILSALISFDIANILSFAFGALCGILSFVRVLSYALENYYSATIALLTGIMIGSVRRILLSIPAIEVDISLFYALICILLGLMLPLALQYVAGKKEK